MQSLELVSFFSNFLISNYVCEFMEIFFKQQLLFFMIESLNESNILDIIIKLFMINV